jgi:hypothetical protein
MAVLGILLGIYVAAVAVTGWVVARLIARWAPGVRLPVVLGVLVLAAVFFVPVPIHGGFLLLGPEVVHEALAEWRRGRSAAADTRRAALDEGRFAGWLPETEIDEAWRDPSTGLVWSPSIGVAAAIDPAALADARRRCAAYAPAGYWALPRNAEYFWLARTGHATGAWLADAYLWPEGISLPTRVTFPDARGTEVTTAIRCVAVTPPAPVRGYRSADIPRDDWNAFQLGLARTPLP